MRIVSHDRFHTIEKIKKQRKTANQTVSLIERKEIACIELECGHLVPKKFFNKVPTRNTQCPICDGVGDFKWRSTQEQLFY